MKTKFLIPILLICLSGEVYSQLPELLGVTYAGGEKNTGAIVKIKGDSTNSEMPFSFKINYEGINPFGSLIQASDGMLYGMTTGGSFGIGNIFRLDLSGKNYTVLHYFVDSTGRSPQGSLIQANDGKLYGVTAVGGLHSNGVLFSFDLTNNVYTDLHDFIQQPPPLSGGNLMQASNGKLYGLTFAGGAHSIGTIYSYDISSKTYTTVHDFTGGANGGDPYGSLIQASDGKLYGLAGTALFCFNITDSTFSKMATLSSINGWDDNGSLVEASNGKLYGTIFKGGVDSSGTIFSYNPLDSVYTELHYFDRINAGGPNGNLIQADNGKLYGMTVGGGIDGGGIFSFDITNNSYINLHDFVQITGKAPWGGLIQANNGKMYGMTFGGGNSNQDGIGDGVIFSFDPLNNVYTALIVLNTPLNGLNPICDLVQSYNRKLYGICGNGGINSSGVIFAFNPFDSTCITVHDFDGVNGSDPRTGLMQAIDGKLYGLTQYGGSPDSLGVIYSFDPLTNAYSNLFSFTGLNGAGPIGKLLQAHNGKLYGLTRNGGANNFGVIFSFDLSTNIYNKLFDFDSANGSVPIGSLIQATDGKLYGLTSTGGANNLGVIFCFDPSNNKYVDLYNLSLPKGSSPLSSLIQANNGKLYGVTNLGGLNNKGVIFGFDLSNNLYTDLFDFDGSHGSEPYYTTLIQAIDNKLYGTTAYGGVKNKGVIFSYDIVTNIYSKLLDFKGTNGANPLGSLVEIDFNKTCSAVFSILADTSQMHHYTITNYSFGEGAINYDWNWGDGGHDYTPYPSHTYADSGFYDICLSITDSTGCQSTFCDSSFHAMRTTNTMVYINVVPPIITAAKEINLKTQQVIIYPNPVSKELRIMSAGLIIKKIEIFNVLGERAWSSQPETTNNKPETAIDVSSLPAGIFFVQVSNETHRWTGKFVKE